MDNPTPEAETVDHTGPTDPPGDTDDPAEASDSTVQSAESAEAVEPEESAAAVEPVELTDRQRQMLDFEHQWWRHAGAKEQAIRDTFDLSTTRYYQVLNALLDEPAAMAYDPILVKRLRRLRATRVRARTPRRP